MKQKFLYVMPECYVDTNLTEYLLDAAVNHQHSCTKVVGLLKDKFADKFAVGIIDKDKVELGYIRECDEVAKTAHLTLLKHKTRQHYLITISPAIDGFVLDCAKEQKVNPEDFDIPSELKSFTKVSKSVTSNADTRFKKLFDAIKDNEEIQVLKSVLKYLSQNLYGSEIERLKILFNGE